MSKTAGDRSTPLAARLLALVIVPLLAVGFLATQRIEVERAAASDASDLVDTVELQQAVAALLPPAQLERIMLSGLAAIDASGIPRELVVGISGFDIESINGDNLADLERAFDTLTDEYRSLELSDGTLLGDRLGPIRGALQTQRDLSDEGRATSRTSRERSSSWTCCWPRSSRRELLQQCRHLVRSKSNRSSTRSPTSS